MRASSGPYQSLPGLSVRRHRFEVPLDHGNPRAGSLELFAREVRAAGQEAEDLPWLVFLQGGPGYEAPRPTEASGWIGRAVQDHAVLLLDQRGTGLSSPLDPVHVAALGDAATQAAHMALFRADSIVADCEAIRPTVTGGAPWRILGPSFGGFCATRYLSAAPEGLSGALITGGIPGLEATAAEVYAHTYPLCEQKHVLWFERYPEDEQRLLDLYAHLGEHEVLLTDGDRLTPERLSMVGLQLGMSDGLEAVHGLLEQAQPEGGGPAGRGFLRAYERTVLHDHHPIFSVLHEGCYTQGAASRWAATAEAAQHAGYPSSGAPLTRLNGEMIHPWMFEQIGALRPLAEAAQLLAEKEDWPQLYDPAQLERNEVPAAAAVYTHDMYVPRALSMETAARIPHLSVWETDAYEHNGLRADGARILDELLSRLEQA